jgi:hypothetical protein
MTGNKSYLEYIYLHQRQENVLKLWIISAFENCNQETHGNVCYTFLSRRLLAQFTIKEKVPVKPRTNYF